MGLHTLTSTFEKGAEKGGLLTRWLQTSCQGLALSSKSQAISQGYSFLNKEKLISDFLNATSLLHLYANVSQIKSLENIS